MTRSFIDVCLLGKGWMPKWKKGIGAKSCGEFPNANFRYRIVSKNIQLVSGMVRILDTRGYILRPVVNLKPGFEKLILF